MKIIDKIKKYIAEDNTKSENELRNELNYPIKTKRLVLSAIICGGCLLVSGSALDKNIVVGLFILFIGIYCFYMMIYKLVKSYEVHYGSSQYGDEVFKK